MISQNQKRATSPFLIVSTFDNECIKVYNQLMLSRKYRANRLDIGETMKTGISIFGAFLYAKISRKEAVKAGFAIVISKKNEKTSVGRHLIKRKISSFIEEDVSKMDKNFKKTVVFLIKKTNEVINYNEVKKDVKFVLEKAGFYK